MIVVGIAGGSGSGKTTISDAIAARIPDLQQISHDAYYKDLTDLSFAEREKVNFDHPDSLDSALLADWGHLPETRAKVSTIDDESMHSIYSKDRCSEV